MNHLSIGIALLSKQAKLSQCRRVVTLLVCLRAPIEVLPQCRGGKRQGQQCGEDAFHALIECLVGSGVNGKVAIDGRAASD